MFVDPGRHVRLAVDHEATFHHADVLQDSFGKYLRERLTASGDALQLFVQSVAFWVAGADALQHLQQHWVLLAYREQLRHRYLYDCLFHLSTVVYRLLALYADTFGGGGAPTGCLADVDNDDVPRAGSQHCVLFVVRNIVDAQGPHVHHQDVFAGPIDPLELHATSLGALSLRQLSLLGADGAGTGAGTGASRAARAPGDSAVDPGDSAVDASRGSCFGCVNFYFRTCLIVASSTQTG